MLIFLIAVNTIIFLFNLITKNRSTLMFKLSTEFLVYVISILISLTLPTWMLIIDIVIPMVYIGLTIWFLRYPEYNFSKGVWSFSKFNNNLKNNKADNTKRRVIGSIEAYDEDEIKYDGLNLSVNENIINQHTLLVAGSGAGKSRLMRSLMRQDIKSGHNIVLFDYKRAQDMSNAMLSYAKKNGYETFIMSRAMYDFSYDPMPHMSQTAIKQILMNTQDNWQDYYKNETIQFLDKAIYEFEKENNTLEKKENYLPKLKNYILDKYTESDGRRNALSTINFFLGSELGAMFSGLIERRLDYQRLIKSKQKFMVVVTFTDAEKDFAAGTTSIFLTDLLTTFEQNKDFAPKVYGDEASSLSNSDIWGNLLSRGRSAGLGTLLAYQSLHQVSSNNDTNEGAIKLMLDSVETKIILASNNNKETAKYMADSTYEEGVEEKIESLEMYNPKTNTPPTLYLLNSDNGVTKGKTRGFVAKTIYFDMEAENAKYPNYLDQTERDYKKLVNQSKEAKHVDIDIDRKNEQVNNGQREIHDSDLTSFL